jgi:L-amino acid N-acyltransferase YncA
VSVDVRPARPDDLEAIVEVGMRAWREGFKGVVPLDMPDRKEMAERVGRRVREPGGPVAIAELDGALCGWVSFGASRDDDAGPRVGEVYALNVDPARWRRGVGRSLVAHALERLAGSGFSEAMLWTLAETPRSRGFYESLGFEHDGATQRRQMTGGALEVRYRIGLRNEGRLDAKREAIEANRAIVSPKLREID